MHLKNESARLIFINLREGETETTYQIAPGDNPAVEVPDSAAKMDFVKSLLKSGDLRRVGADELGIEEDEELTEPTLAEQAELLGIKVDKRWSEETLREEIAKAQV